MTRLTKWAFENKSAMGLIVVLLLALGTFSYLTLPKEFLPSIDQPMVTVTVLGQGMDTSTMADSVTTPIEDAVTALKGKTDVLSTTASGYSTVQINFDNKTSMKDAKAEVQDALSNVTLPSTVGKPIVAQLNTSMIPIEDVALTFPGAITQDELNQVKQDVVPRFQDVPGVAQAMLYGAHHATVIVHVDKTKLAALHLPLQALTGVLQGRNLTTSIGNQTIAGQDANIQVTSNVASLDDLGNLPVIPGVKLKDIATLEQSTDAHSLTRVNGKDALVIVITKSADSNAVQVAAKVGKVIDQVNHDYGSKFHTSIAFSTADQVVGAVNSMTREVLMGALFATLVILLFLRSVRMTFITVVSIPLSLGLTLFLLSHSGVTLNVLTLGAVAVAVGRLVDDSIVVIENIYRKSQHEGVHRATIIDAVREVATAITSSTLTTVAVFLPMGLVQGSLRQLLLPFGLTVTYSLLSSLLVALTVVPLMSLGLIKGAAIQQHHRPKRYIRMLRFALNHKSIPLTIAGLLFVGSIGAYVALPKAAIDSSDAKTVSITLKYPSATPYATVKAGAEQLDAFISKQSEPKTFITMLGSNDQDAQFGKLQSPTQDTVTVVMKDNVNADHFIQSIKSQKANYPTADLSVGAASFTGSSTDVNLELYSHDVSKLHSASTIVMNAVKNIDGVQKVSTNEGDTKPVYNIQVDPKKANAADISTALSAILNQIPIGNMKLNGSDTPVYIANANTINSVSDLSNLSVATKTGIVSLGSIATIQKVDTPSTILRKNSNEYLNIALQIDPKKLSIIQQQIALKTKNLSLPSGVTISTTGATTDQASQFGDLFNTMLASIGLVYLIMVITFKRLREPLAILFTLPLAAIGAILGLLVTRTPVDPSALIGALLLIGIVVTNAIVLLDRVRQKEEELTIREAVLEAASTRVRPILMTATATIFAMLPLLFSKPEAGSIVSKSLAVVVIGGLAVSTLLTLIIVPVLHELLYYRKSRRQRRRLKVRDTAMQG